MLTFHASVTSHYVATALLASGLHAQPAHVQNSAQIAT